MPQKNRLLDRFPWRSWLSPLITLGLAAPLTFSLANAVEATTRVPRPTITPTVGAFPDLVVDSARIAVPGYQGGCISGGSVSLSLHICIKSRGAASGPFDLSVNGEPFARVDGIDSDAVVCALGRYTYPRDTTVILDTENEVAESDEGNNEWTQFVPIPSRPPVCTATPTPTPTPSSRPCPGDCDGDARVWVNELLLGINIMLDRAAFDSCPYYAPCVDHCAHVNDLIDAVNAALHGCP